MEVITFCKGVRNFYNEGKGGREGGNGVEWLHLIVDAVREHGYISLFLFLSIGLFTFPVPNEVLLIASGFLATTSLLEPVFTYCIVYLSILVHGTTLYLIGKFVSMRAFFLTRKSTSIWYRLANRGREIIDRYGLKAACFSYFFPFVRHAVPFTIGLSRHSFPLFAFTSYSSALIWMSIYFFIGFYFGRTIPDWESFVEQIILTLVILGSLFIFLQWWRRKRKRLQELDH